MDIKEALMSMDALDDDQWTGDGAPKVDVVAEAVGEKVTRQMIVDLAPEFSQTNMVIASEEPPEEEQAKPEGGGPVSDAEAKAEASMEAISEYLADDPLPEAEFIPLLMRTDPEALEMLERVLVEQLSAAEAAISTAEDLKNRVKRSLAFTRARIKRDVPDMTNQQAIQSFIKSQSKQRGIRVETTRELLAGVDLKSLDPRSAIDRAMARKTQRGGARPTRSKM